jgi:ATP-binding cassette subfamily D (ALD) protein 3
MDKAVYDFVTTLPQHRTRTVLLLAASLTSAYVIDKKRRELLKFKAPPDLTASQRKQLSGKRVGVDRQFLNQLRRILPVCIPGVQSVEFGLLSGLAIILIGRTWLDIWFSNFNGTVVRAIVSRDWDLFVRNAVVLFGVMMWPMSVVNNSMKLVINMMGLRFRQRLTTHAHSKYLSNLVFYQVANLDNRIQNADQLLTQDIDKFAETLAHLYSDIAKPIVDIGLFAYKLGQSIGGEAPVLMLLYFATSGSILRLISPPFGKCTTTTVTNH